MATQQSGRIHFIGVDCTPVSAGGRGDFSCNARSWVHLLLAFASEASGPLGQRDDSRRRSEKESHANGYDPQWIAQVIVDC